MASAPTEQDPSSARTDEQLAEKPVEISSEVVAASSTTLFNSVANLPADLVPTGMQVNKFSGYYVHLTVNPKYFDWNGFVAAVNNYHGGDLFPVPIQSPKKSGVTLQHGIIPGSEVVQISSDTSPGDNEALAVRGAADVALSTILNWMIYILHDVLEIAVNVQELRATVYNTFTNLKWASSSGFADFSSSSSGSNSSWEYRTVYAYPKPGDPTKFLSMVTTIKLEANITTQSSWWGLVSSTTARFYANITAMKLSVTKGFKSPV